MNSSHLKSEDRFSFIAGPILPRYIVEEIQNHQSELQTGAYSLFLGQVRNDEIDGKEVMAIEYSAYKEMVIKQAGSIIQKLMKDYDIHGLRVLHSLETVRSGEVSLMVLATAGHRVAAMGACREAVNLIKSELPIWGKELFEDGKHAWKKNH